VQAANSAASSITLLLKNNRLFVITMTQKTGRTNKKVKKEALFRFRMDWHVFRAGLLSGYFPGSAHILPFQPALKKRLIHQGNIKSWMKMAETIPYGLAASSASKPSNMGDL